MDFALPFGNGLIIMKILQSKKSLTKRMGAEIQMNVEPILQPIFHEAYGVESAFVLH
jgi:hypothetical protein